MQDQITYFRPRIEGPELAIEDAVLKNIPKLISKNSERFWIAGSLPIGAGMPDVLITLYNPKVLKLSEIEANNYKILAYLRLKPYSDLDSLAKLTNLSAKKFNAQIEWLLDEKVIFAKSKGYYLFPVWYEILPEIVAVEAKVSDWQTVISQAARNRIFAHRSLIALPTKVAHRIKNNAILKKLGLGLLSVDEENNVSLLRKGRSSQPSVWSYYYKLAFLLANNQTKTDALYNSNSYCSGRFP